MARPKIEIDQKQFEALCKIQCTLEEVADYFDCSDTTIHRWCKKTYKKSFEDIYKKKSAGGRRSLRRIQWEAAQNGDKTMMIWLGRQWLGQTDKFTVVEKQGDKQLSVLDEIAIELMHDKKSVD